MLPYYITTSDADPGPFYTHGPDPNQNCINQTLFKLQTSLYLQHTCYYFLDLQIRITKIVPLSHLKINFGPGIDYEFVDFAKNSFEVRFPNIAVKKDTFYLLSRKCKNFQEKKTNSSGIQRKNIARGIIKGGFLALDFSSFQKFQKFWAKKRIPISIGRIHSIIRR